MEQFVNQADGNVGSIK